MSHFCECRKKTTLHLVLRKFMIFRYASILDNGTREESREEDNARESIQDTRPGEKPNDMVYASLSGHQQTDDWTCNDLKEPGAGRSSNAPNQIQSEQFPASIGIIPQSKSSDGVN